MAKHSLQIIGVHPYRPSAEVFDQTVEYLYGDDLDGEDLASSKEVVRQLFDSLFVIELRGSELGAEFEWSDITQEIPGQPRDNWQAPYDERPTDRERNTWAFFFHALDQNRPLITPSGELALPAVTPLPVHLHDMEYEAP